MISDTLNATPKHLLCQRLHLLLQLTIFLKLMKLSSHV